VLLTRVEYLKHGEEKNFAIVDAAMNDLMRPALYDAYLRFVRQESGIMPHSAMKWSGRSAKTGDFIGHDRELAIARNPCWLCFPQGRTG